MSWLRPTEKIQDRLRELKHDRWGWVIYRCTYGDDEAWSRFKEIIDQRSRGIIADFGTPEVGDSLEWTFVEDRRTLNGASRDQLRSRFKAWAAKAIRREQPRAENDETFGVPRYNFFIQVDEGALRSVVYEAPQPPNMDVDGKGYVNFVDANWKPLIKILPAKAREVREIDQSYEPIDGCREEDVGWMKIGSVMAGPDFYDAMTGSPDVWYDFYERPPETVVY